MPLLKQNVVTIVKGEQVRRNIHRPIGLLLFKSCLITKFKLLNCIQCRDCGRASARSAANRSDRDGGGSVARRCSSRPDSAEYFFACIKAIWFLNEVLGEVAGRGVGGAGESSREKPISPEGGRVVRPLIKQHTNTHSPASLPTASDRFLTALKNLLISDSEKTVRRLSDRFEIGI